MLGSRQSGSAQAERAGAMLRDMVEVGASWSMWGRRGTAGASIPVSLAFENIEQRFGKVTALGGVSLAIEPGEVICLLGQSGCGKSTLLRVAAGAETPSAGRVLLDGVEVAGPSRFVEPDQRGVGLMFQDYALFPHLTILDNVSYGIRGLPAADTRASAMRALARVGLESFGGSYPHMLSGGEQQRVALARAIAPRPGVILMDEPFSNLDRRLKDAVRDDTIAVIRETGATCIIVTHDPEDAMRLADRVVLMRAGKVAQVGPAEELYLRPCDLFVARFFSDFNEVRGVVSSGAVATPFGPVPAPGLPEGQSAVVCVRPQSVLLGPIGTGLPGRILSRRFLGEVDALQVVVEGLDRPLAIRAPEHKPFAEGDDVGIDIRRDEVLVFGQGEP
jgi:iron(III) transport system ATP-binding protein